MTISELAEFPASQTVLVDENVRTIVLTETDARAIAETYQDACDRCHTLAEELAAARAEAERNRVALAAALTGKVPA